MADRIVDLLTLAGVLALVALPVAVIVIGALVWINRRRARAIKDWVARHGELKRRLADVEALRRKHPAPHNWGPERDDVSTCKDCGDVTVNGAQFATARDRCPARDPVPSMIREHLGDDGWHDEYGRERG